MQPSPGCALLPLPGRKSRERAKSRLRPWGRGRVVTDQGRSHGPRCGPEGPGHAELALEVVHLVQRCPGRPGSSRAAQRV